MAKLIAADAEYYSGEFYALLNPCIRVHGGTVIIIASVVSIT